MVGGVADASRAAARARGNRPVVEGPATPAIADVSGDYGKVFIVGCPRSGTTWLSKLLGANRRSLFTDESHIYRDVYWRIDAPRRPSVLRWAAVLAQDARRRAVGPVGIQVYVDRDELLDLVADALTLDWSDLDRAEWLIWSAASRFVERNATVDDPVLVEKTPDHLDWAPHILDTFPEARIIELVRDPRDVAVSMEQLRKRADWPPATREAQFARWIGSVEAGRALRARPEYEGRVTLARYEALHEDPVGEVRRLLEFSGLDFDDAAVDHAVESNRFDKMPVPKGEGQYSRKGTVGDWSNHFSAADLDLFEQMIGDRYADLGYTI